MSGDKSPDEAIWRELVESYELSPDTEPGSAPWPDRENLTEPPAGPPRQPGQQPAAGKANPGENEESPASAARQGTAGQNTAGPDTAGPDTAAPDTAAPDTAAPDTAGPGKTGPGTAGPGKTGTGTVGPGTAGLGTASQGTAEPATADQGTASQGTAEPATPDQGTASQGTAQGTGNTTSGNGTTGNGRTGDGPSGLGMAGPAGSEISPAAPGPRPGAGPGSASRPAADRARIVRHADPLAWRPATSPEATGDEDERYVPPPAPPLRLDPVAKGAWAALFGGPGYLLLATIMGWQVSGWSALLAIVAFVGGFAVVFLRLGDGPPRGDGPDNGAVV